MSIPGLETQQLVQQSQYAERVIFVYFENICAPGHPLCSPHDWNDQSPAQKSWGVKETSTKYATPNKGQCI